MIGCSTLVSMVEWAYMLFVHHCCLFSLELAFHSGYLVLFIYLFIFKTCNVSWFDELQCNYAILF